MGLALGFAHEDDRVFAHVGEEEIIGVGNQAIMANKELGAAKYLLHLLLVNFLIPKDISA